MEPIRIPIEDVLDLHTFNPKEIAYLLDDYLKECVHHNIFTLRIIHGKGSGILKQKTRSVLKRHDLVESFHDAPAESGGWGATIVTLKKMTNADNKP